MPVTVKLQCSRIRHCEYNEEQETQTLPTRTQVKGCSVIGERPRGLWEHVGSL